MKKQSTLIIIVLLFNLSFKAQNDTLNKYNSNKKKEGFWVCYLDENLKETCITKAIYYGYELFDNGKNLTHIGERNMKVYRVDIPKTLKNDLLPILLDGTFILMNKNGSEKSIEEYRNGYPYILRSLTTYKNLIEFEQEYIDYSRKYENQKGSFYWEERSTNLKDTAKYWFRKVDGKWKGIKIN